MRHNKTMKKTRWGLAKIIGVVMAEAMMLLLSSCGNSPRQQAIETLSEKYSVPEEKHLIVYTSHKEEVYLPIIREFENRTGIWVELHAGGTAEMIAQVKEASEIGACDIMCYRADTKRSENWRFNHISTGME